MNSVSSLSDSTPFSRNLIVMSKGYFRAEWQKGSARWNGGAERTGLDSAIEIKACAPAARIPTWH
ncbi:hypothetical protein AM571_PB00346 (plasmid) [Rhizobium etli 8C-3]|uniref:Uncharacterized protein n=1 Tax=Rhizobium etli 8C-3 TaxID=538025 RepID=A0A1L5PBL7_RHIET|nr:hypothetical protein AM571_PB00346 [Rhizobium etli 8C-3]ARM91391.1 hypothetical protein RHEC894_PC00367 [Rhizobium sp. CIAT894]